MSILIDPNKEFVTIQLWYVEDKNERNGTSKFYFIRNKEDEQYWKQRGYIPVTELEKQQQQNQTPSQPGMPAKSPIDSTKIIHVLRTWWSQMCWREQNQLFSKCLKQSTDINGESKADLDAIAFRDYKLKTCLKRWDLKENGKEVACAESTIDQLHPEVAQELLTQFEALTEASEEQIKNLSGQLVNG